MQRLVYRSAFRRPPVKKPTCERASALEVDKTLYLMFTGRIPQYPTQVHQDRCPAAIAPVKAGSMASAGADHMVVPGSIPGGATAINYHVGNGLLDAELQTPVEGNG